MALSGSTDFTLTAREVIYDALRRIGVSDITQTPNAEDVQVGLTQLQHLLNSWQLTGPHLWLKKEGTLPLTQGTDSYDLPQNVLKILSCRIDNGSTEIPMNPMTRDGYNNLPNKTTEGYPTNFYFNSDLDISSLKVWPTASDGNFSVNYTYQKRIDDVDSLEDNLEIPKENLLTISFALSDLLCIYYQIDDNKITQKSEQLMQQAQDFDREPTVRFVSRSARKNNATN